jgi:tRNA dimethylallyltransferase
MKTIAIIGPTASGKTAIAHTLAQQANAVLLSCDSLSVFKEIDIASAKPAPDERAGLTYFGIDCVEPCKRFGADDFIAEFKRAQALCEVQNRPLVIVGGSGFYLQALLTGLSTLPPLTDEIQGAVERQLQDPIRAHAYLAKYDPDYTARIAPQDRYRIEKALLIILATGKAPTQWFRENPPRPLLGRACLFEVQWPTQALRARIQERSAQMLQTGLIEEVCHLERRCGRGAQAMRAIGIKEVLSYLDGRLSFDRLTESITTHTAQLAKRQRTYNRHQFKGLTSLSPEGVEKAALAAILSKNA